MTDTPQGVDLERLQPWFAANVDGATGAPLTASLISGGRSNLTYTVADGAHEWVLRRPPLGHVLPTAHDMAREYKVLAGLAPHRRAGAAYRSRSATTTTVNDAPFYVMEKVDGQILRTPAEMAELGARRRPPLLRSARRRARRRSTPSTTTPSASPTSAIPTATSNARCAGGASSGSARRRASCPAIDELARRLRAALPESPAPTIVHGDYRLDNTMLAPDDPGRIVAVLDWEMATLGDPLADMGLFLVYWARDETRVAASARRSTRARGFMTRDEIVERYAKQSGRDVSQLDFYEVLASYKLAIILEGIHARFLMGKTLGEGFEHIGSMVEAMVARRARPSIAVFDSRAARLTRSQPQRPTRGSERMGVLDGVKVLEVAEQGFVPSAAAILADWGADVVKVERPTGDPLRHYAKLGVVPNVEGFNILFEQFNRNKRGVAIDLRNDDGRARARRADRVGRRVHHQLPARRPATKLRLRTDDVWAVNPRCVYAIGSGQGLEGPDAELGRVRRGVVLGAGRHRVTSSRREGAPLVMSRGAIGDAPSGAYLAGGIAAALVKLARTGEASVVDVSLLGAAVWTLSVDLVATAATGRRGRSRTCPAARSAGRCSIGSYRTADGRWLSLNMLDQERYWEPACRALGLERLIDDPDYATTEARQRARRTSCTTSSSRRSARSPLDDLKARLAAEDTIWSTMASPSEVDRRPAGRGQRLHAHGARPPDRATHVRTGAVRRRGPRDPPARARHRRAHRRGLARDRLRRDARSHNCGAPEPLRESAGSSAAR